MRIDQLVKNNALFDFYGGLLTDNQQSILRSYLEYNASLSEIADEFGITRQGVSDILRRAIKRLEDLENTLGLVAKYEKIVLNIPVVAKKITNNTDLQNQIDVEFSKLIKTLED